jgi:hypothetical protein
VPGAGRRIIARDVLLTLQIATCVVLVTSSMFAIRGLSAAAVPGKVAGSLRTLIPSAAKAHASQLFATIAKDANKVPVELQNSQVSRSQTHGLAAQNTARAHDQ